MPAGNTCWGAVEYALLNGQQRSVSYQSVRTQQGLNFTTAKLSNLGFHDPASASGAKVCFKLRDSASTQCPSAAAFCGGSSCRVSLFNAAADCCPTSSNTITFPR